MEGPALLDTAPKTVNATDAPQATESNFGRWMALTAALLGWMFDGFEMGLFPLIGGPALADLLGPRQPQARRRSGSARSSPCFSSARRPAACSSAGSAIASAASARCR